MDDDNGLNEAMLELESSPLLNDILVRRAQCGEQWHDKELVQKWMRVISGAPYLPSEDDARNAQTGAEALEVAGYDEWPPAVTRDGVNLLEGTESPAYEGDATRMDVTFTQATPWCVLCGAVDSQVADTQGYQSRVRFCPGARGSYSVL